MLNIESIPSTTGVYIFKKGNVYLYVGKSVNMKARIRSHIENAKVDIKESLIITNSDSVNFFVTDSEFKAILLEAKLIQDHKPKYNIIWKDNKSYLYIQITTHNTYPKVLLSRKPRVADARYFGPFSSVRTATLLLKEIRKLIPFCMQKNISSRPCFYSKLGLCNPCPNEIEKKIEKGELRIANELKRKYKNNIRTVIRILKGNVKNVLEAFYKEIKSLSKQHRYEEAIIVRNKILRFEELLYRRSLHDEGGYNYDQSEESLTSLLKLLQKYLPHLLSLRRIECYDVSNLFQKNSTASMVVLIEGHIYKPDYRKFKIRNKNLSSDFEMLAEIIQRRFKQVWDKPDLLVIDGGKPQLKMVMKVLSNQCISIPAVGLAKNPDRLVIGVPSGMQTLYFDQNNNGFNLLRLLRDESHRFARKYHLLLRDKNFLV